MIQSAVSPKNIVGLNVGHHHHYHHHEVHSCQLFAEVTENDKLRNVAHDPLDKLEQGQACVGG